MKKHIIEFVFILSLPILFSGCKTPVAQQSGMEDIAYLLFISPNEYAGKEVTVFLDDNEPFNVKVVQEKDSRRKGIQYGVKTGLRSIKITNGEKILYQKKIFISTQEIKNIILP